MELDIKLKRANKVYHIGVICFSILFKFVFFKFEFCFFLQENLSGVVVVDCKTDSKHDGLYLSVDANVNMQLSSKNVGVFEAFYNSVRVLLVYLF